MRKYFFPAMVILLQFVNSAFAQQLKFNRVIDFNTSRGSISDIAQDQQGYIWLSIGLGGNGGRGGVYRYDGSKAIPFLNDPANPNSLANNWAECLVIDSSNIVWIGTYGSGLDKYDPATNKFTHFTKNNHSLANDTVTALLEDHKGNLWVGTYGGLNLMDKKTGKFTHYTCDATNARSLSNNEVRAIYEDRQGTLWVGCGSVWDRNEKHEDGGLNRFDRSTGAFTRYLHDPSDPNSIVNNKVRAMFEDSKGNFWVGTAGDGLHIMDRAKGTFTHYYYDSTHPERLSRPPFYKENSTDHITFITEDITGCIWIGSFMNGINKYDPNAKKITHYGRVIRGNSLISAKDTAEGFKDIFGWATLTSKSGMLWISTLTGNLYNVNPFTSVVKYFPIKANANSFYKEPGKNVLWIATFQGLIREDMNSGNAKTWRHDPRDINSLCNDSISVMRADDDGDFWLPTSNGLCKFDPNTNHFTTWRHNEKDKNSLSSNLLNNLFIDHNKNIWIATYTTGLDKLDTKTGVFTNFQSSADSNSLVNNSVISVCEDANHTLWIGTGRGLSRLENNGTKFKTYLKRLAILNVYVDAKGIAWAGASDGLYRYDGSSDQFMPFTILGAQPISDAVLHILEDNDQNLWVAAANSIIKINRNRDEFKMYGERSGVHKNTFLFSDNFKSKEGELFFGDQEGYYAFFPNQLEDNNIPPQLSFSAFKLGDEVMQPGQGGVLKAPIWRAEEIKLKHDQNIFSFDFIAMNYGSAGEIKYLFMLENYDNTWHNIGTDHTAYFFNVPPRNYIFHAKVMSIDGTSAEKTISIIIMPPWWRTWWAYCTYVLLLIVIGLAVYRFIKQRIIQNEQEKARVKELAQAKEIEKAYHNLEQTHEALKSTQTQLIQSEKMASLGELTAGIAHEIQNPLNFVNNFSEVNSELIKELKSELIKGNFEEVSAIANDIESNSEKINQHGKRADGIVKNMLQHSRSSSSVKEPADINALADEYLRLSYHGLRAKDKSFNATIKTDFDKSVGKINFIPQEIGRVILNLINNAFYAVGEKEKQNVNARLPDGQGYEPTVSVSTRKGNGKVEVSVKDNGNGIPKKVLDKIFQPFFTTKPTGQGTGLGLSLAYDIVKAHGGEIKVETKEGDGSEFVIQLPIV